MRRKDFPGGHSNFFDFETFFILSEHEKLKSTNKQIQTKNIEDLLIKRMDNI